MKMLQSIDAHTHVQFPEFDQDRDAVIKRAQEVGMGMINAGADVESSQKSVALAHDYAGWMWATVGIHPTELQDAPSLSVIAQLAHDTAVVGIGECGLDYFRSTHSDVPSVQKKLFISHIVLAHNTQKPLVIHCREAFKDIIDILQAHRDALLSNPGILHFFTGTVDDARMLLELNFSFTFGGLVTFNHSFDEVIRFIPHDHILVETDAPFVAPRSHRGTRNEPTYMSETITTLGAINNVSAEEMTRITLDNARHLFCLTV